MQEEEDKVDLDRTVSVFSLRFVWVCAVIIILKYFCLLCYVSLLLWMSSMNVEVLKIHNCVVHLLKKHQAETSQWPEVVLRCIREIKIISSSFLKET